MLFPFPLELFPFPFPLVAKNYSHSHGNPIGMGIPIPMHTSTTDGVVCRSVFHDREPCKYGWLQFFFWNDWIFSQNF